MNIMEVMVQEDFVQNHANSSIIQFQKLINVIVASFVEKNFLSLQV